MSKTPTTIITGFLGAGKTTLVRHLLEHAPGKRIAIIVNEFGAIGIDGETLRNCGIAGCAETDIVELANGCLCCTVADDFIPTMTALLDRPAPPDHIIIETSGLALPKPLIKAFTWPGIGTRVTVDGVIAVVDGPAVAAGRFADDPAEIARQRAADPSLDHDNPLAELFEDQVRAADLIVLNKTDLLSPADLAEIRATITATVPRTVKLVAASGGKIDPAIIFGIEAAAEHDLAARPSHHDADDGAHEHDDFESFSLEIAPADHPDALIARLRAATETHDILRIKGFAAITGKPMRLALQGVGTRFTHHYDRPWQPGEPRAGQLVIIGLTGLDRTAIAVLVGAMPIAA